MLPDAEHSTSLRRAVIAATVGTTIEWYDFFIYSTAAGLVFPKLFFPHQNPLTGVLAAFGTYFIGFVGRPIGAMIFGHYGDRIGRKATLISTLLLMGTATFLIAFVPSYAVIGMWGAVILTFLRLLQGIGVGGEWGGSVLISMEWARGHGSRGLVASWPQFGVPAGLFLANLAILGFSALSGPGFATWGWRVPFFLSIILITIGLWIRLGILETPVFRRLLETKKLERAPTLEVWAQAAAPDHPLRSHTHGRTNAILHIYRLRLRLRHHRAAPAAQPYTDRGSGRLLPVIRCHPGVWPHFRQDRPPDVPDRAATTGIFGFIYFGLLGTASLPWCSSRYRCPLFAQHDLRSRSCPHRRGLHPAPPLQRRLARLPACLHHRRRPRAARRHRTVRQLSHRHSDCLLHRGVRRD